MSDPERPNLGAILMPGADPDRVALICEGRSWRYGELAAEADAVARGLARRGLRRGDRVAVLAANSAAFVAAYFGAMRAGMALVPVNWKLPAETIAYILRLAEARLVLADAERAPLAPADLPRVLMAGADWRGFLDPGPFAPVATEPGEIAQILFTSGSTGHPKGVPLSHEGQHWAVRAVSRADVSGDRLLVAAPMFHMNALFNLKFAFYNRASVVLLPAFTAAAFSQAIIAHGCTWLTGVPTMFALLANHHDGGPTPPEFARVRRLFIGSSPFSQGLIDRMRALFPAASVTNGYGTTEAGPAVFGPHPAGLPTPDVALGVPIAGAELRLRGADGAIVAGPGEGMIEMRNPAVMAGYLNLPEQSATVLDDGWYRSGDIARRDADGFYFYLSRADDMFVSSGENIWPNEVETLLERHPEVQQSVVVPIPDEIKNALPVAFVVRRPNSGVTEAALKNFALAHGPAYAHPRRVVFLEALPLAGTNKIDRKALERQARELFSANRGD